MCLRVALLPGQCAAPRKKLKISGGKTNVQWRSALQNATAHAARHAGNSLISPVLASRAPSIFREIRHCTFVCTENAPLYFRFFGQHGRVVSYRLRRKRSTRMLAGVAPIQRLRVAAIDPLRLPARSLPSVCSQPKADVLCRWSPIQRHPGPRLRMFQRVFLWHCRLTAASSRIPSRDLPAENSNTPAPSQSSTARRP